MRPRRSLTRSAGALSYYLRYTASTPCGGFIRRYNTGNTIFVCIFIVTYLRRIIRLYDDMTTKQETHIYHTDTPLGRAHSHAVPSAQLSGGEQADPQAGHSSESDTSGQSTSANMLARYGRNITAQAIYHQLDPLVGRKREIERMVQILGRRKKNNPIILGEPGVGKTSLVEGLAQFIESEAAPSSLKDKIIWELNLTALVAGTKYRGELEERILTLIKELLLHPQYIIFIDEIHMLMGAGSSSSTSGIADILKPALASGRIQCIGATTLREYRQHIETDTALARRFQPITLEPNSREETLEILQQIRTKYESYHHVHYTNSALEAMVELSDRYLPDRLLPDKAIDLMDEAGSKHGRRTQGAQSDEDALRQHNRRLEEVVRAKLSAIKAGNFAESTRLREEERRIQSTIATLLESMQTISTEDYPHITGEDIAQLVASMTGIPLERIDTEGKTSLAQLGQTLSRRIIGQETAIEAVCRAIQRSRLGLNGAHRPMGCFLFLGPSGVGKTLLARHLAEEVFGSVQALIRVDMSEYMERHTATRLTGAPPSYVGYEDGGQLTERIRRRPYSVVLFDEIEKAHPEVHNLLLQVLDEGRLTDSTGRTVDFSHSIIILTSNVGSRDAEERGRGLGYVAHERSTNLKQELVDKALKRTFRPEFINRLDALVHFTPLEPANLERIARIELGEVINRAKAQGYHVAVSEEAIQHLAQQAYSSTYGARALKRMLRQHVEDALVERILSGELSEGIQLSINLDPKAEALTYHLSPLPEPITHS